MRIIGWRAERDLAVEAHLLWLSRTVGEFVSGFLLYFPPRPLQEFGPSSAIRRFFAERYRIVPWVSRWTWFCSRAWTLAVRQLWCETLNGSFELLIIKKKKKDNMIDEFCHSVVFFSLSLSFWSLMLSPYRDTASRCARGEAWCHRV